MTVTPSDGGMGSGSAGSGARTPIPGPEALGMRLVIVSGRPRPGVPVEDGDSE